MFDHRIRTASKPPYRLIAALTVLVLVAAYTGIRYWNSAFTIPNRAQSPLLMKQGLQGSPSVGNPVAPTAQKREPVIRQLAILVFKSEKRMEVWSGSRQNWTLLREYPVLAASGASGPKLIEGDRQVPEGVYRIVEMNPNSRFHRSCKLDYPNAFDQKMAEQDGRTKLGGDICIHGKNCSIGCVAIGDPAIEDLYSLIQQTGPGHVTVILAPNDLRGHIPVKNPHLKLKWIKDLYQTIGTALEPFRKPEKV